MLLLDSEALSAVAHGPPARRDKVRALIIQMRLRELPVGTVAAVLAEVPSESHLGQLKGLEEFLQQDPAGMSRYFAFWQHHDSRRTGTTTVG